MVKTLLIIGIWVNPESTIPPLIGRTINFITTIDLLLILVNIPIGILLPRLVQPYYWIQNHYNVSINQRRWGAGHDQFSMKEPATAIEASPNRCHLWLWLSSTGHYSPLLATDNDQPLIISWVYFRHFCWSLVNEVTMTHQQPPLAVINK